MDSLSAVLLSQSTIVEENFRLRALLDLRDRGGARFIAASAVRPGTEGSESMFLLDVGADNGVSVNDLVVVARGLVGVVREVGPRTALAMDWTHPDFRVSAMTEDGEVFGLVGPEQGAFREEDRLLFDGIPYYDTVADSALVLTSGRGIHPRGVLVGKVLEAAEAEVGWRKSFWIRPAVPPGSATHVLVLIRESSESLESLAPLWGAEDAQDSLDFERAPSEPELPEARGPDEAPSP
jgi:rod shape-determining protein MreC